MSFELPTELVDKIMEEAKEPIEDKLKKLSLNELINIQNKTIRNYIMYKKFEVKKKYRPFKDCFIKLIFNNSGGYRPNLTKYGKLRKVRDATILFEEIININPEGVYLNEIELDDLLYRLDYSIAINEDLLDKDKIEFIDCKEKYYKKGMKFRRCLTIHLEDIISMEKIIDFPLIHFENKRGNPIS